MAERPPFPAAEDAVMALRAEMAVAEALLEYVVPEDEDVSAMLGLPRRRSSMLVEQDTDMRTAFRLTVDRLREAVDRVSRVTLGPP